MPDLAHEIAAHADQGIPDQAQVDGPLGAQLSGDPAKEVGKGETDELGDQQRGDEVDRRVLHTARSKHLLAIDRRHVDDRADPVVVQPKGDQKKHQLLVAPQIAERASQAPEPGHDGRDPWPASCGPAWLAHVAKEGDGKDQPPDAHGKERKTGHPLGPRNAPQIALRREHDHGNVHSQQQPASQVSQRVPQAGDPVHLVLARHVRQQGIIEHVGARKPDPPDDIENDRGQPTAPPDANHQQRGQDAHAREHAQELFLGGAIVGDRAEDDRQHGHDRRCDGRRQPPYLRGPTLLDPSQASSHHRPKERGQHSGTDRGDERRIGPVVHRPRPDRPLVRLFVHCLHDLSPRPPRSTSKADI